MSKSRAIVASALVALLVLFSTGVAAQPRLSPQGGTVVSVTATTGGGITVLGTLAKPTIGLSTACASGETLVWSGTAWGCGTAFGGLVTSSDFTGAGTAISPLDLSSNVTMTGRLDVAGTAGFFTITAESSDSSALLGTRTLAGNTRDDRGAIAGTTLGTMDTTASDLYNMGVRGQTTVTKSAGANNLHDWGVFGRAGTEGGATNVAYETIGINGGGWEGTSYSVGGSFRGGTANGAAMGTYGQADNSGTGQSFGSVGHARSGPKRVGAYGVAVPGGATTNIGVWARLGAYTETQPSGSFALYADGVSTFTDDATFESGTCVINSVGITCGGTLITPTATISGVSAGNGLTGGGTTGTVTLDVVCLTGLTCAANDISITARDFGDITTTSSGSVWTIDNDVVTYAKMQNVSATSRFLGRITAGAGDPEELTGTQATTLLDQASTVATTQGVVPGSNGQTTKFLRGDMTWQTVTSITNSASANYYAKSDGTNLVNGVTKDDGTTWSINTTAGGSTAKFTVTEASGNTAISGTLGVTGAGTFTDALTVNNGAGATGDFTVKKQTSGTAFSVLAASGNTSVGGTLDVASTLTVATSQLLDVKDRTRTRFLQGGSTAPTASTCGTSPTVATNSTNLAGKVTFGSGSPSACTITFDGTWPITPVCLAWTNGGASSVSMHIPTSTSTTAFTFSTDTGSSGTIGYWQCIGGQ